MAQKLDNEQQTKKNTRGRGGELNLLSLPNLISWLKYWLENKGNIMYHTKQWIFRRNHIN